MILPHHAEFRGRKFIFLGIVGLSAFLAVRRGLALGVTPFAPIIAHVGLFFFGYWSIKMFMGLLYLLGGPSPRAIRGYNLMVFYWMTVQPAWTLVDELAFGGGGTVNNGWFGNSIFSACVGMAAASINAYHDSLRRREPDATTACPSGLSEEDAD